jgi:N-acetyltransferase
MSGPVLMFDFQPKLDGDLVGMRPMQREDWDALLAVASDPLIWELHPVRCRYQEIVFRQFVEETFADQGGLVALDKDTREIIGFSRYSAQYVEPGEIEIGWTFLARAYWGGAHNRDMKRIMLAHALASYDRALFRVGEDNLRSRGAMEKIGGQLIDRQQSIKIGDRDVNHLFYQIARNRFAACFAQTAS